MKYNKSDLITALTVINHAAPSRAAIPILGNVLIAGGTLTATNLEVRHTVTIPVEEDVPIEFTVPLRSLLEICKRSSCEQVEINYSNEGALIKVGTATFKLAGLPADDFPEEAKKDVIAEFDADMTRLKQLVASVKHAASNDAARLVLNGVLLEFTSDSIRAVATDGRIVSHLDCGTGGNFILHNSVPAMEDGPAKIKLIPVILHNSAIPSFLAMEDGPAQIKLITGAMIIRQSNQRLVAKVIDGKYPKWRLAIPNTTGMVQAEFATKEILSALSMSSIYQSEHIQLRICDGSIIAEKDGYTDSMPCKSTGPANIMISCKYLSSALSAVKSDQVSLYASESSSAIVLRGGKEDPEQVIATMKWK